MNGIRATFDGTNSGTWSISETDTISYVNGSVGIGTEEPAHDLDVSGSVNCSELLVNGTAPSFGGDYLKIYENYTETFDDYDEDVSNVIVDSASSSGTGGVWDLSNSNTISYTNGNVGIGTDMPESALQVAGNIEDPPTTSGVHLGYSLNNSKIFLVPNTSTANSEIEFYSLDSGDYGKIEYDHTNNRLQFQTNSADRMTIDSDGNVGIGTTSPTYTLDVNGNIYANNNYLLGGNNIYGLGTYLNIEAPYLRFRTDSNTDDVMRISSNGYVGIGTSSPESALHVTGTIGGTLTEGVHLGTPNNTHSSIELVSSDGANSYIDFSIPGVDYGARIIRNSYHNTLTIQNNGGDSGWGYLNFHGTNIGINKTNPAVALDINGWIKASGDFACQYTRITGRSSQAYIAHSNFPDDLISGDTGSTYQKNYAVQLNSVGNNRFNASSALSLCIQNSAQLTVNSLGNVGIGTTEPSYKLHIAGTCLLYTSPSPRD